MARILLVDDEQDVRDMLRAALRLHGHNVDTAGSAEEAMHLATRKDYDIAILDYVLPGIRGLELLQKLRGHQRFLRSIIISGQIDHDVLDAAELEKQLRDRIAADRYVPKPATTETLVRAIAEVLEPVDAGNWKQLAADVTRGQGVRKAHVRRMDRDLLKAKKKKRKK